MAAPQPPPPTTLLAPLPSTETTAALAVPPELLPTPLQHQINPIANYTNQTSNVIFCARLSPPVVPLLSPEYTYDLNTYEPHVEQGSDVTLPPNYNCMVLPWSSCLRYQPDLPVMPPRAGHRFSRNNLVYASNLHNMQLDLTARNLPQNYLLRLHHILIQPPHQQSLLPNRNTTQYAHAEPPFRYRHFLVRTHFDQLPPNNDHVSPSSLPLSHLTSNTSTVTSLHETFQTSVLS